MSVASSTRRRELHLLGVLRIVYVALTAPLGADHWWICILSIGCERLQQIDLNSIALTSWRRTGLSTSKVHRVCQSHLPHVGWNCTCRVYYALCGVDRSARRRSLVDLHSVHWVRTIATDRFELYTIRASNC